MPSIGRAAIGVNGVPALTPSDDFGLSNLLADLSSLGL